MNNRYFTGTAKSRIQVISENMQLKSTFFDNLKSLDNKYDINGHVFCCDKYGSAVTVETGFYGNLKTLDTIDECAKDFDIYTQGIYVSGDKYHVGNLYGSLDKVEEEFIIDLANKKVVYA